MEETKAVQVGIRQSTALTDGNNADFPPPATSGGANEHQMAGEAEQAAKARLFAQLFGGGSVESDTDSLLSDCSECLSDSSHNVSETAAASIKHPSLAKPKSKEREPSSRATRRGSRSAQGLKQTDQKENTPNTRKELGNSAPSNLYNPFKLLARSPFDGSFGVSFLANGLNHASAVNASISAQNEWDEVCDDWAAIVSVSPAVVQPHNQSHSINYDGNYEYTVGSDLLKNHSSGSVNNETPLSTTPAASTSFIQPPPAFLSDDNCAACLGRGELLCCDSCPKVFHFCCVAEGFSNDGLDAPNMWECNACRWRNIHGKCYAPELNLPKPIKTVKRTKNSSPSPQPAENESSRIKSAFDVLSHVIDGHNPRSFELPNHIWMPYACVYKHPLTGDYIDLIQTEVIEVAAPAPNGTAPPLTRRNNSAFLSRASVTSTASTNPVYPTTTTFSATTSAEWTQVVTRIKGTVADWVHDPQYNQFNISLSALKQNFATTVVDKTKKPETKYILTTSPTHSHPPFTRTLPFCHACALSAPGRQDMIKCDHCDVWWHPECLPILFFAAPISRSITSATLSGGGVPGGTIGHARTPPPTRDVDCVDVAFARDVRRRCWGSMWMEADESGGKQGSVYFRRRWMCPLHVDWAVSDAGVGSMRVRRRKRKRVFVVDCTDAGEKVVSGQIVEMDNVLKGKAVGIGVADGSEMDTVILPGEGGAEAAMLTLLTGNVAETGDKVGGVGDDSSQLLIVNVEDEPVSSPSGISASFSVEMDQIDGASRNDAEQEDVILKRKIRIKADPSVLAMIAALTNSYRQNDDGVVIQIPAKLNQFQKSFGVGRGSVKTKRGRAAATATVTAAYIPKNDPQSAVNSENRVDKNVENENSFSSNGLEAKSKPATDVIFQHTARSEFGNISPNLHVAIDNDLNEDLGEEDDEAVTNANIESEAKIIENSLDDVPIINTAIPKKSLEMIDLSNSISGENYQKKTTHDTLNSENNVSNGSLLDTVNKTDAFDSERAEKHHNSESQLNAITDNSAVNANFMFVKVHDETQSTSTQPALSIPVPVRRGRGRPRKSDMSVSSSPIPMSSAAMTPVISLSQRPQGLQTPMAYMCPEPGCGKGYPERWRLKSHMMLHTNEFLCTIENCLCGNKPFMSFYHLDRHQKKVLGTTVLFGGSRKSSRNFSANDGSSPKRAKKFAAFSRPKTKEGVYSSENPDRSGSPNGFVPDNIPAAAAAEVVIKTEQLQRNQSANIEPVENQFHCTVAGCGKAFVSSGFLHRHFQKIHMLVPASLVSTGEGTNGNQGGSQGDVKQYNCESCGKVLVSFKSLLRHKERIHKLIVPTFDLTLNNAGIVTNQIFDDTEIRKTNKSNNSPETSAIIPDGTTTVRLAIETTIKLTAPQNEAFVTATSTHIPVKTRPVIEKKHVCPFINCGWKFNSKWSLDKHLNAHSNGRYRDLEDGTKPIAAFVPKLKKSNGGGFIIKLNRKKLGRHGGGGGTIGAHTSDDMGNGSGGGGSSSVSSAGAVAIGGGGSNGHILENLKIPYKFPAALRRIVYVVGARRFKGFRGVAHFVPNKTFRVDFGGYVSFVESVDDEWIDMEAGEIISATKDSAEGSLSILMDALEQVAALEERSDLEREVIYELLELKPK